MNNWCIYWFFTHIFTGILIFKGLTARRLYKSFGFKGLTGTSWDISLEQYDWLLLGRPRHRWEDNRKMDLQEEGLGVWTGFSWLRIGTVCGQL
jgi:hypothetical protein